MFWVACSRCLARDGPYGAKPARRMVDSLIDTLMILPLPAWAITAATTLASRKYPLTLVANRSRNRNLHLSRGACR